MSVLSWNEIRARASVFAEEWADAGYEKGQTQLSAAFAQHHARIPLNQSPEQRAQVRRIANWSKSGGTLDYVCTWFIKAAEYVQSTLAPNPSPASGGGELVRAQTNSPRPRLLMEERGLLFSPRPLAGEGAGERANKWCRFGRFTQGT